jgi:hypothetical protein
MKREMTIARFRMLMGQAGYVIDLRHQTEAVLAERSIRSFDGFGHLLDTVLGDDPACLTALAQTVNLSSNAIDQLRASALDPFSVSIEAVVYLGFVLGIELADFSRLIEIDHGRFAHHAASVLDRSGDTTPSDIGQTVQELWLRFEEDRATAL